MYLKLKLGPCGYWALPSDCGFTPLLLLSIAHDRGARPKSGLCRLYTERESFQLRNPQTQLSPKRQRRGGREGGSWKKMKIKYVFYLHIRMFNFSASLFSVLTAILIDCSLCLHWLFPILPRVCIGCIYPSSCPYWLHPSFLVSLLAVSILPRVLIGWRHPSSCPYWLMPSFLVSLLAVQCSYPTSCPYWLLPSLLVLLLVVPIFTGL